MFSYACSRNVCKSADIRWQALSGLLSSTSREETKPDSRVGGLTNTGFMHQGFFLGMEWGGGSLSLESIAYVEFVAQKLTFVCIGDVIIIPFQQSAKEPASFDRPGQHPRELNPFWKDGGEGLPPEEQRVSEGRGSDTREKPRGVGDGRRSWMLRAYKRALEQAENEGKPLEEIASDRWGSIEKLHSLLRTAGIDPTNPDARPPSGRKEYLHSHSWDREDERRRRRAREEGDCHGERDERRRGEGERRDGRRDDGSRREGRRERGGRREEEDRERDRRRPRGNAGGFLKPGEPAGLDSNRFAGFTTSSSSRAATSSSDNWRKKRTAESSRTDSVRSNRTSSGHRPAKNSSPTNDHSSPPSPPSPPPPPPSPPRPPPAETNDYRDSAPRELVTDTALNALGAKLMKAEMMGNGDKVEKLRKELDALRELKVRQEQGGEALAEGRGGGGGRNQGGTSRREEETLVLTKTDRFGRAKPLEFPSSSRPGPSRTPTHTKKGKREKYFADDDHYSLKALVEQERMTTAEETHAAIARMAAKFVPASNADETVDDVLDSASITKKFNPARDEERQRQRAILESRKMADVLENCRFCFGSPQFSKHLLVAIGIHVYLTVPSHQSLTPGHCLLVPTEHTMCSMALDENVWSEVQVFQKGLTHMFSAQGMDAVFMETYTSTRRKTHMCIECIPVPKAEGELVPMYFKKAILESDEEWAQNKKLVDTRKKGVRSSIPTGLPYFFVDFGLDGGYAHIIEDQSKFPHYFGREVIGGLLDLEPRFWLKPPKEDFERQKEKVLQLSKWWKPYDWTQKLT